MLDWLESLPAEVFHARYVLNGEGRGTRGGDAWVPPNYKPKLSLSERWRRDREEEQRKGGPPASLPELLRRLEHEEREAKAQEEDTTHVLACRPCCVFGATPLLSDQLPEEQRLAEEAWLRQKLPPDLLEQRERYERERHGSVAVQFSEGFE
ncbi:hypothetical protein DIPPA_32837 [Diplonema papillatum]|nr:hypothetical protein DIPPA_32837 [Diplonema papillatum]|eukprot:gene13530-20838_t